MTASADGTAAGDAPVTVWWGDADGRASSAWLIRAVAATFGLPAGGLGVEREPGGRPRVTGAGDVHVALAHTRDVVAVAVSRAGPVGVDVEPVRRLPVASLARRWYAEEESDWLSGLPAAVHADAFLMLWTQKEAVGKALGAGLRGRGLRRAVPRVLPVPTVARWGPVVPGIAVRSGVWCRDGLMFAVAAGCDVDGPLPVHRGVTG